MEEREKLWIYINKEDWAFPAQFYFATHMAISYSRKRYVDRLTKKQQNAINYLRMLDMDEVIPGVGCKIKGYGNKKLAAGMGTIRVPVAAGMGTIRVPVTVYLLNC